MLAFKTNLNTIPANIPYLRSDPVLAETWRNKLHASGDRRKIGLAWAGAPTHLNNRNRSIPLRSFAALTDIQNADFFSLQKGDPSQKIAASGIPLVDHTALLTDFAQTAALIDNLDLVVTVDTSVAHLAGALGKPVWVLIPSNPDWRWMLDRPDSPWYPAMRLYRQPRRGEWAGPIEQIARDLKIN